MADFTVDL